MPTSKVNVTITINTKRADGTLTTVDRWDIISSAASTVRAAIEQYVELQGSEEDARNGYPNRPIAGAHKCQDQKRTRGSHQPITIRPFLDSNTDHRHTADRSAGVNLEKGSVKDGRHRPSYLVLLHRK